MLFHCYTYDWLGVKPIRKGSYKTQSEAVLAADGAGLYSAIVINKERGLIYMNVAAWMWGGLEKDRDVIKNPDREGEGILIGGKPLPSNIQALVDKARRDGNF